MMSKFLSLFIALALAAPAQQWTIASPGYRYQFPRDHFAHPDYQTEWWYYTGNLKTVTGHRYGFELTFFRQGVRLPEQAAESEDPVWRPDELYLAHLALSDIDGKKFYHFERLNRAGPGLAGVTADPGCYWNGNWQVLWKDTATGEQKLQAVSTEFRLDLNLKPDKPPVIHGSEGLSRKGPAAAQASHYISFTRISATGKLEVGEKTIEVSGLAWMDHEFFTESPDPNLRGWDWFAVQLQGNRELMLYRLRDNSGHETPYSSGTYIDPAGDSHFLDANQFSLSPQAAWTSPHSGAKYPVKWRIEIPSLHLSISETTSLDDQELATSGVSPGYWEGAVNYEGEMSGKPVTGVGYLEMTGYSKALHLGGDDLLAPPK